MATRCRDRGRENIRIGVRLVVNPDRRGEVRIDRVDPDSPDSRAGLQVGDMIRAIDGDPARDIPDLIARIRSGGACVSRTFSVVRAGTPKEIVVVPEVRPPMKEPAKAMFDVVPASCRVEFVKAAKAVLRWSGLWLAVISMAVVCLIGRRHLLSPGSLVVWTVGALLASVFASPATLFGVCTALKGWPRGGLILWLLAQHVTLLIGGLVAMRRMHRAGLLNVRLEPSITPRRAFALSLLYMVAVNVRINILSAAYDAFAPAAVPRFAPEATASLAAGLAAPAQIVLTSVVVVIGPMAEEILFRGVILPRLTVWMGAVCAVLFTSAIFAMIHNPVGWRTAVIFAEALGLGWARLRTGGLAAPVAIHMVINAVATLFELRHT